MLSKLRALSAECIPNDYGTMLESMCKWDKVGDVLEMISDWLAASLLTEGASDSVVTSGGAKVSCLCDHISSLQV